MRDRDIMQDWPYAKCRKDPRKCDRGVKRTADNDDQCRLWVEWFRHWWPIVTGKKKAAPSGANTESGKLG